MHVFFLKSAIAALKAFLPVTPKTRLIINNCDDYYIGKTKHRLQVRKTENFRALPSNSHSSAIADHMTQTGHRIKWDHFDILATGQSDIHRKIKKTLLLRDLQPALNENVGSEKLLLYIYIHTYIYIFSSRFN